MDTTATVSLDTLQPEDFIMGIAIIPDSLIEQMKEANSERGNKLDHSEE